MSEQLAILAFGAHPDDVEIGAGGTLAHYAKLGYSVGICNLTQAEMSSNGTPETRQIEAAKAAEILGVTTLLQLDLGDRRLRPELAAIEEVVKVIRQFRPQIVLSPPPTDRHPDHEWCYQIVREAMFSAGLRKFLIGQEYLPYRPQHFYQYLINDFQRPAFVFDVSSVYDLKLLALKAYTSQFQVATGTASTVLNRGTFLQAIEGRDSVLGHEAGVTYAEGFLSEKPLLFNTLI